MRYMTIKIFAKTYTDEVVIFHEDKIGNNFKEVQCIFESIGKITNKNLLGFVAPSKLVIELCLTNE
jgi:hypothetical protein